MRLLPALFLATTALFPVAARAQDDLSSLSDEFENATRLGEWQRIHQVEGWNADQLELLDLDGTQPGRMVLMPHTVSWYEDWRGPLVFKEVDGDFVVTVEVHPRGRDGVSMPGGQYSLGGVMIRTPRAITNPATDWTPGGENYVFLSHGRASGVNPGYEFEVKTTEDGNSNLEVSPAGADFATLQIARIGNAVLCLRRAGNGPWTVHRRYDRSDMPSTLQVGLVSYTDWAHVSIVDPYTHNGSVLVGGENVPDIVAGYEYARFARPQVPTTWSGLDPSDPGQISDAELLNVLAENANPQPTAAPVARASEVKLRVAGPNPFNPNTALELEVERATTLRVAVYDAAGRLVRVLANGSFEPGAHRVAWDGHDDAGVPVASGVYLARAESMDLGPRHAPSVRMVLVK